MIDTTQRFACLFATILTISAVQANDTFEVEYANNSPIKNVPLKNATLMIELYDNEKPHGYKEVTTDANATFTLKEGQDFEVVSIKGERQYQAHCSGYTTTAHRKIQISCDSR